MRFPDKVITIFCMCLLLVSCDGRMEKALKSVDALIAGRLDFYDRYECGLQPLKDSLCSRELNFEKWKWSEQLYLSYRHFNLDSAFRYVNNLEQFASNQKQKILSSIYKTGIMLQRHDERGAENLYQTIDTAEVMSAGLMKEYLSSGVDLYSHKSIYGPDIFKEKSRILLAEFRRRYVEEDSLSFFGKKTLALTALNDGSYDDALAILRKMENTETDSHNLASVCYNQARVYLRMGDNIGRIKSLIKSVEYDFQCPVRNYLSLYELALMLYENNSLTRASKYITANLSDVIAGNFSVRMINSGKAQMIIAEAANKLERERSIWLLTTLCCFCVLFLVLCIMFYKNGLHSKRLETTKNKLAEMNSKLKRTNQELHYANKIKDGYLFSYMDLSIHYLEKIQQTRQEIKTAAKTNGMDAVMKILRSPVELYSEYNLYYRVFDETFLGIFPNFVEDVNKLLDESARFPVLKDKVLTTELRLLAAIRLGITESGKIAKFLNCAPTTVYTYRTRLKRSAICPKGDFEYEISKI